ncbi:Gfo/Idh/MocA family protein [Halalkalicoccus jeotgali]|uniref:Oxidoreductase n=1 Tax=Halalkalicoccus jeotgali (strain DSM 18796 / CECT 7217 / JCM 14584 / KCTC 4019 / B3) TaxID=795797 RepID=D8J2H5_HALJB|nr:Gfo/Idh/MocA family oxidoreductase [Halalkalicoccus jeotgali]ADJ14932.1 oxidoreductase [Halalkalicoccus jeotgali B3]ELY35052.1 oxidoreductase [Halalkalicoccus jeotgali B3]
MTEQSIRLGVVGLGFMGTVHAENTAEFGHDVVAGVDLDADARETFGSRFGASTYEDYDEMYDAEDLDAVAVSVPNKFHEPAVVAALERGVDVLCEKPLAHTLESAERIAATARDSEGFCAVNFHNRLSAAAEMLKGYDQEGKFGELTHVRGNYVRWRGVPGLGTWFTSKELAGGGALVDIGVHAIDFALYLLDFPAVEEVMGISRSNVAGREDYADPEDWGTGEGEFDVEDSVTALIRCETGQTVSLEVSWAASQEPTNEFTVRGTEAGARLSLGEDELELFETGHQGTDHFVRSELEGSLPETGWAASDKLFAESVARGEAPELNTVEQALTVQRVIDAVYRSAEEGTSVRIE